MSEQILLTPIRFLVKTLTKFKVIHQERIPDKGSILMTTNHLSRLDTPLLLAIGDRKDFVGIIAKEYQEKSLIKWVLEKVGTMIWMDRDATDFSAIREALHHLRHGSFVGIAPEGTRSRETKGLLQGKPGAALMAVRADVPILPVGIIGSDKIYQNWLKLRRPPIIVNVGQPYSLPVIGTEDRQAWIVRCIDEIMCRIAVLLPPEYRGYYAEHPRLKALLQSATADELVFNGG
jgi:1-acyl-sn-glycerol-3-phosphate acyltransferase